MTTGNTGKIRQPAVAGTFYPSEPDRCAETARQLVQAGRAANATMGAGDRIWIGAIVPHAGWICSGAIAGQAIAASAGLGRESGQQENPDIVVVFGAIHTPIPTAAAMLCSAELWAEPTGLSASCVALGASLAKASQLFQVDDRFHRSEHAVEVELPLIQCAWPGTAILPVEVPLADSASEIGLRTAQRINDLGLRAVYLASSDLTHYGPNYGFTPAGVGPRAMDWAKENDRRLLDIVLDMAGEKVIPEVRSHGNACGGGAITAMIAACKALGAKTAKLLRHANSVEMLSSVAPQPPTNAVGYAAVVVG